MEYRAAEALMDVTTSSRHWKQCLFDCETMQAVVRAIAIGSRTKACPTSNWKSIPTDSFCEFLGYVAGVTRAILPTQLDYKALSFRTKSS